MVRIIREITPPPVASPVLWLWEESCRKAAADASGTKVNVPFFGGERTLNFRHIHNRKRGPPLNMKRPLGAFP